MYSRTAVQIDPATWTERLDAQITDRLGDSSGAVVNYPGQSGVIAFNLSTSMYFSDLLLPRLETNDEIDITALAVFIGSYGCKLLLHGYTILNWSIIIMQLSNLPVWVIILNLQ